ncbi:MFS general substrate transporter [Anaeromyces robustus]|uniref:MFS general substrate transporter n=1 Tax=Anaeromyces robustus TaxID=1754192 RepID=A0A1Y1WP71_9FUNG|nr:MFS general substrate transporter [Anaeromyces robustus]|eukprot:ORX75341.1 MFS general substrate transporter [Anaeromyces robustus]
MYALMSIVTEYATSIGSTASVAGLVSGIYIFGGLCSRVYTGNALGRIRWRKIAITFLTLHFLACLLYFFVNNNVIILILVRLIHGIGFGGASNSIVTIASGVLPKKRFGEAFGYLMLGTTISVGLGPYISGIIYDYFSSVGCFIAASIFSAIALISMYFLDINKYDPKNKSRVKKDTKVKEDVKEKENSTTIEVVTDIEVKENIEMSEDITKKIDIKEDNDNKEKEDIKEIKEKKDNDNNSNNNKNKFISLIEKVFEIRAIPVALFCGLTSLGYVSILSFYRLYANQINLATVFSWFFIVYSLSLVVSRPIAGKIQDRHGDKLISATGIIAQSLGLFLIAYIPNTYTVLISAVCIALGFGTLNSACTAIVTRNTPDSRKSFAISTLFIFCDATMGFGPALLGSFVSSTSGYTPVYYISSVITLVALPICLLCLKK